MNHLNLGVIDGTYNTNRQIKFKTSMLKLSLCDYSDVHVHGEGTITITGGPPDAADANKRGEKRDKGLISKNCAQFTDCINEINNI